MLHFELSKIMDSTERTVANGATVTAEGQALVNDAVNGGVKPATGAANEQFAGVAFAQQITPTAFPKVETLIAASSEVTIGETPLASTLLVKRADTGAVLAAGTPSGDATKYSISGKVITVNSALNGVGIVVAYRYAPTTLQVKIAQGDIPPGGAAALLIGRVGVITKGDIVTTEFDTSVDWTTVTSAAPITLGANGLFTIGGSGGTVAGAYVTQLPVDSSPFLGIHFTA